MNGGPQSSEAGISWLLRLPQYRYVQPLAQGKVVVDCNHARPSRRAA